MKKYYNATLFTLLSFLLSFNLYGQVGGGPATPLNKCLFAYADLIIEDVIWDADVSDLIEFYETKGTPLPLSFSHRPPNLNGVPVPESFHIAVLGYNISIPFNARNTDYTFDISITPTAKPVIFVINEVDGANHTFWHLFTDENGYVRGMRIHRNLGGTGVASVLGVMGREGNREIGVDMCIDITTTNRKGNLDSTICSLDDVNYSSCRTPQPSNKETQDIINIYPNPIKNDLFVEANDIDIKKIELLTLQGQIQNQISTHYGIDKLQINTGSLQAGIYLLKLETNAGTIVKKVIAQ